MIKNISQNWFGYRTLLFTMLLLLVEHLIILVYGKPLCSIEVVEWALEYERKGSNLYSAIYLPLMFEQVLFLSVHKV